MEAAGDGCKELDLIASLDDATSEIYSAFLVAEEGIMSTFQVLGEGIGAQGPAALSTPTGRATVLTPPSRVSRSPGISQPSSAGRAAARWMLAFIAAR